VRKSRTLEWPQNKNCGKLSICSAKYRNRGNHQAATKEKIIKHKPQAKPQSNGAHTRGPGKWLKTLENFSIWWQNLRNFLGQEGVKRPHLHPPQKLQVSVGKL